MPCMCGDTHCGSCGPAQGYNKCPNCGAWSDDENEEGGIGCVDLAACIKACEERDKAEYESYVDTAKGIADEHHHPYVEGQRCTYFRCEYHKAKRA